MRDFPEGQRVQIRSGQHSGEMGIVQLNPQSGKTTEKSYNSWFVWVILDGNAQGGWFVVTMVEKIIS